MMKKINENNVEAWMLDYLEGNLSDGQSKKLLTFVEAHPELGIDPDFSDFHILEAPEIPFAGKADLFRTDINIPELSEEEIDCIARLEGDMIPVKAEAFDKSLESNPEKAALFLSLQQTILKPDTSKFFSNKESLYKKGILIPLNVYRFVSAAAVLILAWVIFTPRESVQESPLMAQDTSRQIIYINKIVNPGIFDKIAMADPVMTPAVSSIEAVDDIDRMEESISAVKKLPIREIENSSAINDKSFAFIYRTLPYPEDDDYQTLLAFTGEKIRENILGMDHDLVKKSRFSLWELADAGLEKVAGFFGLPADLKREYNDKGELVVVDFDSRLFAFTTPIRSRRNSQSQ